MRRGELWSVSVCPLTTYAVDAPLLRIEVEPTATNGLRDASYVMVDKTTTTRRSSLGERLGTISAEQMLRVERSLLVFLGIAD